MDTDDQSTSTVIVPRTGKCVVGVAKLGTVAGYAGKVWDRLAIVTNLERVGLRDLHGHCRRLTLLLRNANQIGIGKRLGIF
jgi:hypothetical protein